jgi:hypothetical protein
VTRGARSRLARSTATILIKSKLPSPRAVLERGSVPWTNSAADFRTCGIGAKRLRTGRDGVRFCFKTPDMAEAFRPGLGEIYQPVAGGMNASNDE